MASSVYIHIPFCSSICTYCDFAKLYYNKKWVNEYLDSLLEEVKSNYQNEVLKTLYIGGGTPSCLDILELTKLFEMIKIFKLDLDAEFTIECNINDITYEKALLFKQNKVNRISIGIQTFNPKYIKFLGRNHDKETVKNKIKMLKDMGFTNINVDLMYAFKGQTIEELNKDIDEFLSLEVNHISTYSLMIEPNTVLYNEGITNIDEDLDYEMYQLISKRLKNYNHYEISNYALDNTSSKHNLVYWNNEEYYGFGLGASGYINGIRYDNIRNIKDYINGCYILNKHKLSYNEKLENEFILGLRKIKGINKQEFYQKYNLNINDIKIVNELIKEKKLIDNGTNIYINYDMIYISNSILVNFIGEIMDKCSYFKKELNYIKDIKMLDNAKRLIELLPDYFFEVAASSTGKYHPSFAQGKEGLVRHTKAAVRFAHELLENECIGKSFNDKEKDLIIIALIMHDGCKHGLVKNQYVVADHPLIVSRLIKDNKDKLTLTDEELELLCSMIETHMGQFNKDYKGHTLMPLPHNRYQNFVHMCDFLASKKFLDIKFDGNDICE